MAFAGRALDAIRGAPDEVSELVDATVRAVQVGFAHARKNARDLI